MSKNLTVNCPTCQKDVEWAEVNSYRPFCSQRCKDSDFCGWANEEKVIGGTSDYADILSGDLALGESEEF